METLHLSNLQRHAWRRQGRVQISNAPNPPVNIKNSRIPPVALALAAVALDSLHHFIELKITWR